MSKKLYPCDGDLGYCPHGEQPSCRDACGLGVDEDTPEFDGDEYLRQSIFYCFECGEDKHPGITCEEARKRHDWQPVDNQGYIMECLSCGKHVRFGTEEFDKEVDAICPSKEVNYDNTASQ